MPLLWRMGPADRALRALEKMCAADLSTGWGVRILSTRSQLFEPLNYNYGAVWPFLGGYAAAALYNYDFLIPAYQLVLANAGHMFDNALGAPTELFSGALRVWPQEAVAHQGFSVGGFVLPFVRGLLGLDVDAAKREAVFAPRFPGDWPSAAIDNFRVAGEAVSLRYEREGARISLDAVSRPGRRVEAALRARPRARDQDPGRDPERPSPRRPRSGTPQAAFSRRSISRLRARTGSRSRSTRRPRSCLPSANPRWAISTPTSRSSARS